MKFYIAFNVKSTNDNTNVQSGNVNPLASTTTAAVPVPSSAGLTPSSDTCVIALATTSTSSDRVASSSAAHSTSSISCITHPDVRTRTSAIPTSPSFSIASQCSPTTSSVVFHKTSATVPATRSHSVISPTVQKIPSAPTTVVVATISTSTGICIYPTC